VSSGLDRLQGRETRRPVTAGVSNLRMSIIVMCLYKIYVGIEASFHEGVKMQPVPDNFQTQ
jgi:hypothetical protein